MIKDKMYFAFGISVITLAVIMMLGAAYLAFIPVKVISPNVQPYKIITKTVRVGDPVIYQVDICKHLDAPTTVIRRFVDSDNTSYPLPPQVSNIKKGCAKSNVLVITPVLHPGEWYLALDVTYKVNPLRNESYHLTTEKFNIVK